MAVGVSPLVTQCCCIFFEGCSPIAGHLQNSIGEVQVLRRPVGMQPVPHHSQVPISIVKVPTGKYTTGLWR